MEGNGVAGMEPVDDFDLWLGRGLGQVVGGLEEDLFGSSDDARLLGWTLVIVPR